MDINKRADREGGIIRTGIIGILVNIVLAAIKALIGFSSGSIAIVMDALNNLSDVLSSVVTIVGTKLAAAPPDKVHPLGHGRIEYISTVVIAFLVVIAGVSALRESVLKIMHPNPIAFSYLTLGIITIIIGVKILLGTYTKQMGHRLNADSLVASGYDALLDALISFTTLINVILRLFFTINIDGWLGALISLIIIKTGFDILGDSLNTIIGRRTDPELSRALKNRILEDSRIHGIYDLFLENYGPDYIMGSVYIELDDTLSAQEVYEITRNLKKRILEEFNIILTFGIYAVNTEDKEMQTLYNAVRDIVISHEEVMEMHDFYFDKEENIISFDIVIEFAVRDREGYKESLIAELKETFPEHDYCVQVDLDYRD